MLKTYLLNCCPTLVWEVRSKLRHATNSVVSRMKTYAHLCDLDEPPAPVLLHVQVEPLGLDLQHFCRQLLLLWLLTCTHEKTSVQTSSDLNLTYI